jgi:hypothetical protein
MSSAAAAPRSESAVRVDRLVKVVVLSAVALAVLTLYLVEAYLRKTPWVFTDEIEWTQISRAINATGHPARRGQPINFKSLYAYLIAPFWWIHSTTAAYAAIKYANAVVMSLAAVPTYLLARMLVSKRTAVVVAVLAVLIPGMSYASSLIPEVLAYPWYATCSWLIVRALATRRPVAIATAAVACGVAVAVRSPQFFTVPASFLIAGAGLWVTGPRGRRMRAGWDWKDTLGAIVLLAGGLIVFNRVILQHVSEWQISTEYWKNRMVDLGLQAGLALTVGLGILPVLGGFAALRLPERRGNPTYRAFAAYLASSILCISLYTAVKAAYLSTVFGTLTEERNMIYLSPPLLLGTAMVVEARRIDWRIVAAASAFVLFLVWTKPLQLLFPYYEAPGFGILAVANRHLRWDVTDLRWALVVALAVSLGVLVLRHARAVAAGATVLCAAWMLTSEIGTTAGIVNFADRFRSFLPAHLDWIDRVTHGRGVTYVGQAIADPNGLWLTEFWNRSIKHVDSLDGTAPGPGPTGTPTLVSPDGRLTGLEDTPFIVADNGVTLQAPVVCLGCGKPTRLVLYERRGPWRLLDAEQQVWDDNWVPNWSTYTYFEPGQRGTLVVQLGRQGFNGAVPPGRATLTVGSVKVVGGFPFLGHAWTKVHAIVRNGSVQTLRIPVARTPVRVVLRFKGNGFRADAADPRHLEAQVHFSFVPAKQR